MIETNAAKRPRYMVDFDAVSPRGESALEIAFTRFANDSAGREIGCVEKENARLKEPALGSALLDCRKDGNDRMEKTLTVVPSTGFAFVFHCVGRYFSNGCC